MPTVSSCAWERNGRGDGVRLVLIVFASAASVATTGERKSGWKTWYLHRRHNSAILEGNEKRRRSVVRTRTEDRLSRLRDNSNNELSSIIKKMPRL